MKVWLPYSWGLCLRSFRLEQIFSFWIRSALMRPFCCQSFRLARMFSFWIRTYLVCRCNKALTLMFSNILRLRLGYDFSCNLTSDQVEYGYIIWREPDWSTFYTNRIRVVVFSVPNNGKRPRSLEKFEIICSQLCSDVRRSPEVWRCWRYISTRVPIRHELLWTQKLALDSFYYWYVLSIYTLPHF